jgi:selenocysteine lyase/cysteine desulfurase
MIEESANESYWEGVREVFQLDPRFVHLVGFWLSSHPAPVRDTIERHRRELDANPYLYVRSNEDREEAAVRSALARLLGGRASCFALTESTSVGLGLVIAGLECSPVGEILTTEHEHYSAWTLAESLSLRCGMPIKRVQLYDAYEEVSEDLIVHRMLSALSARTRIILLTWVHSSTGVRLPLPRLCKEIKKEYAGRGSTPTIIADATHAVGAVPLSLEESACDIIVGACHKWLLGPRGTAFFWGREETLASIRAIVPSFAPGALHKFVASQEVPVVLAGERLSPGGFHCFEHRWAVPAAITFLETIGFGTVTKRILYLSSALREGLGTIGGVRVVTPRVHALTAGFVCFEIEGRKAEDVCRYLLDRGVLCSAGPYRRSLCRFSTFIYNSLSDVERAIEAVKDLAASSY